MKIDYSHKKIIGVRIVGPQRSAVANVYWVDDWEFHLFDDGVEVRRKTGGCGHSIPWSRVERIEWEVIHD